MMDTDASHKKHAHPNSLIISVVFLVVLVVAGLFIYKAAKHTPARVMDKQTVVVTPTSTAKPTPTVMMKNTDSSDQQLNADTTNTENSLNKLDQEINNTDNSISNQSQDAPQ